VVFAPDIEYPITVQTALAFTVTVIGIVPVVEATAQYLKSHVASGLECTHWNLWAKVRPGEVTLLTIDFMPFPFWAAAA